jgi:SAM-dependent methyltransferase
MANIGVGNQAYYERSYATRSWQFYSYIVGEIVAYSEPGAILDIGAGIGLLTECATRWGLECQGIDGSPDAIAAALQRDPKLRMRQHLQSDPLPFADESFQTVVLNQVIEHLEPEIAHFTLLESFRVLKSNGLIIVHSPSRFNKFEARDDPTHINMYAPTALHDLLSHCGFGRVTATNAPLRLFGGSRVGMALASLAFRATRWDRLSATANCRAYKP